MNTFFTGDQHFGHKNICRFANRPFTSTEEMNEALIKNHNNTVQPGDVVWFLGDFGFMSQSNIKRVLRRLNGQKNLILGNHDKPFMKNAKDFIGSGLLNAIFHYREITLEKQHMVLFHYGMRTWNRAHHGSWHLYGHSHGSLPPHYKSVDVGVDSKEISDEYRPYAFEEIGRFMQSKKFEPVDHHE
jgi:calcineurin-like phosphoesterase family protein